MLKIRHLIGMALMIIAVVLISVGKESHAKVEGVDADAAIEAAQS